MFKAASSYLVIHMSKAWACMGKRKAKPIMQGYQATMYIKTLLLAL